MYPFRSDYAANPSEPCWGICVPLTHGRHAIIDADDYAQLPCLWRYQTYGGYAVRNYRVNGKTVFQLLHRNVIGAESGQIVDHKNRNPLDDRKENLRFTDHSGNSANCSAKTKPHTSQYHGVHWHKGDKRWRAATKVRGKRIIIGLFRCEHEAAKAYNAAVTKYHGEFAHINTIKEPNQ